MAQPQQTELEQVASEGQAPSEGEWAGGAADRRAKNNLGFWRDSAWSRARPDLSTQTTILWLIVVAVVIAGALVISGGMGSPGFSLGMAIGVGVAGFPCVLLFIADYHSLRSGRRQDRPRHQATAEDWERFWAPKGASRGPEGASGWTYGDERTGSDGAASEPVDPQAEVRGAYALLGLPLDAPQKDVRASYHRLAHQFHPDMVREQTEQLRRDAEQTMKELNAAYELLRGR